MMKRCILCGRSIPEKAADCEYCDASQEPGGLGWWWVLIILMPVLPLTVGFMNSGLRDSEAFNAQLIRLSIMMMLVELIVITGLNIIVR